MPRYDDLSREELLRLLEARDRRDATRFGLVWETNEVERDRALNDDFVALNLDPELSVNSPNGWQNLIIEGDNFDALRFLRTTFAGQIKCICIDPPYNTGKRDFVYNDRFVDISDSWRYSMWCEFLYQRLTLARDLLRNDGVLLVCINDESRAKLELLLDKVMPGMRIGSFVWRTKDSSNDASGNLSQVHEHVLIYGGPEFKFFGKPLTLDDYRNPDDDARGDWTPQPITCSKTLLERPNLYYPIQDPKTGYWYPCDPDAVWRYATQERVPKTVKLRGDTIETLIIKDEIFFPSCKSSDVMVFATRKALLQAIRDGKGPRLPKKKTPLLREDLPDLDFWIGKPISPTRPSRKDFLQRKEKMFGPVSSWIASQKEELDFLFEEDSRSYEVLRTGRGGEGTDALKEIMGGKAFSHPKPPSLMRSLVGQSVGDGDIMLDFFAGSGTTAQAVLELNAEDQKKRRFILVSNAEATADEPNKNLCRDVCAERVRRVITGYSDKPGLGGDFAYLRCRRVPAGELVELTHEEVWTALQLMHRDILLPFAEEKLQWMEEDNSALGYVPRMQAGIAGEILTRSRGLTEVVVYTWQPGLLRPRLTALEHVQVAEIPQTLARRFGLRTH